MDTSLLTEFFPLRLDARVADCIRSAEQVVRAQRHVRHTTSFTGQTRHAEVLKHVSLLLDPGEGWKHVEIRGCAFLRDPGRRVRLVVASAHILSAAQGPRLRIKQCHKPFRAGALQANERLCGQLGLFDSLAPTSAPEVVEEEDADAATAVPDGEEQEPWTLFLLVAERDRRVVAELHLLRSAVEGERSGPVVEYRRLLDATVETEVSPAPEFNLGPAPGAPPEPELPSGRPPVIEIGLRDPDAEVDTPDE